MGLNGYFEKDGLIGANKAMTLSGITHRDQSAQSGDGRRDWSG